MSCIFQYLSSPAPSGSTQFPLCITENLRFALEISPKYLAALILRWCMVRTWPSTRSSWDPCDDEAEQQIKDSATDPTRVKEGRIIVIDSVAHLLEEQEANLAKVLATSASLRVSFGRAHFFVGVWHDFVEHEPVKAAACMRRAVKLAEDHCAMNFLGVLIQSGEGGQQDSAEALALFKCACLCFFS